MKCPIVEISRVETACRTSKNGLDWVSDKLSDRAKLLAKQFHECYWEHDEKNKQYLLMLIGKNKKKAGKFFSYWELENCTANTELQDELTSRIVKLLDFVDQKSGRKQE